MATDKVHINVVGPSVGAASKDTGYAACYFSTVNNNTIEVTPEGHTNLVCSVTYEVPFISNPCVFFKGQVSGGPATPNTDVYLPSNPTPNGHKIRLRPEYWTLDAHGFQEHAGPGIYTATLSYDGSFDNFWQAKLMVIVSSGM